MRRLIASVCLGALMATGVAAWGQWATSSPTPTMTSHAARSSVTPTTLADCGAQRDPFDNTNAPPPAGSPAICP